MRRNTKKDLAYQKIKQMLLERHFEPDTMLSENEIAASLGISRTPVREAFQILQNEGFVDVYPKQGVMFKGISTTMARDILELRAAVEGYAAASSLPYTEEQLGRLEALMEEQRKSCEKGDVEEYLRHDAVFHSYFIELYNNSLISGIFRSINERFMSVGLSILWSVESIEYSFASHQEIFTAIKSADASAVLKALHDHIEFGKVQLYKKDAEGKNRVQPAFSAKMAGF